MIITKKKAFSIERCNDLKMVLFLRELIKIYIGPHQENNSFSIDFYIQKHVIFQDHKKCKSCITYLKVQICQSVFLCNFFKA